MNSLGRHILVEYFQCEPSLLNDVSHIEKSMVDAAKAAEATVINSTFHHFSPFGVSGVVVIQESHLAIHTWPEYGYAAVDLFTCGDTVNPWISYNFLKEAFKADYGSAMEMARGQQELMQKLPFEMRVKQPGESGELNGPNGIKSSRNIWFTERDENLALSLRHTGDRLFNSQSEFQKVEVYETYAYGKLLTLDGMIMTTEKDEYVYHEMTSHVPLQSHPDAERILIIGGGDGGVARECFRYERVKEVVLVEIDKMVVDASREFLPEIAAGFDDPRMDLRIEDGIRYAKEAPDESFDIVIVDSTDPVGPGEGLFTETFYRDIHRLLKPGGIMVTQSESPRFNIKVFKEIFQTYRKIYGQDNVHCYLAYIPTYPSGMWSFSYSVKGDRHPVKDMNMEAADQFAEDQGLRYYNAGVHYGAFALPGFVKELLREEVAVQS